MRICAELPDRQSVCHSSWRDLGTTKSYPFFIYSFIYTFMHTSVHFFVGVSCYLLHIVMCTLTSTYLILQHFTTVHCVGCRDGHCRGSWAKRQTRSGYHIWWRFLYLLSPPILASKGCRGVLRVSSCSGSHYTSRFQFVHESLSRSILGWQ